MSMHLAAVLALDKHAKVCAVVYVDTYVCSEPEAENEHAICKMTPVNVGHVPCYYALIAESCDLSRLTIQVKD